MFPIFGMEEWQWQIILWVWVGTGAPVCWLLYRDWWNR